MQQYFYSAVLTLALCSALAPAGASAQELGRRVNGVASAPRGPLLAIPQAPPSQWQPVWMRSSPLAVDADWARRAPALGAQPTPNRRSERGIARKVFGAAVGAAGGFFAGGYLGAAIEGDRCHCDDPGLKGAVIGAPIGAVIGGILGARYLF